MIPDYDEKLYLIRELEWICVLNLDTNFYIRILRIPAYEYDPLYSTNGYLLINDYHQDENEEEPEYYYFSLIWGSKGNKVAKFSIKASFLDHIYN